MTKYQNLSPVTHSTLGTCAHMTRGPGLSEFNPILVTYFTRDNPAHIRHAPRAPAEWVKIPQIDKMSVQWWRVRARVKRSLLSASSLSVCLSPQIVLTEFLTSSSSFICPQTQDKGSVFISIHSNRRLLLLLTH